MENNNKEIDLNILRVLNGTYLLGYVGIFNSNPFYPIQIGSHDMPHTESALFMISEDRTLQDGHTYYDYSYITPTATELTYSSYRSNVVVQGGLSSVNSIVAGFESSPSGLFTGSLPQLRGFYSRLVNGSTGTVNNGSGFYVGDAQNTGGGSITIQYGLYIETLTTGVTNYGIYQNGATINYLGGNTTFNSTPTFNSFQLVLGAITGNQVILSSSAPATTTRTWTIPDIAGNGTFAALQGTQTFTGSKTFSANTTFSSFQLILGPVSGNQVILSSSAPATATRTWTIPDIAANGTFAALEATQTFTGSKTFSSTTGNPIHGTSTNDSASAGYIGEYIESIASSVVNAGTTTQFKDVTSMSLTAGDWDVTGITLFFDNAATITRRQMAISTNSGNTTTDHVFGSNVIEVPATSSPTTADSAGTISNYRLLLSGTTTVYLKVAVDYSAGTPQFQNGKICARRRR